MRLSKGYSFAISFWIVYEAELARRINDGTSHAVFFTLAVLLASLVVSVVATELLRPDPGLEDARPNGLGDIRAPTATEGRVVPLIWGKVKLEGPNVLWYGDLTYDPITETVRTGFFSKKRYITGYKYNIGVQMALCRGPGVELHRVWIDDQVIFSFGTPLTTAGSIATFESETFFGTNPENGMSVTMDFYPGDTDQAVNAYLNDPNRQQVAATTPTCPKYNGTCYVVAREATSAAATAADKGFYLGNSNNIPAWAFEAARYPAIFSGQSAGDNKIGDDANPINVFYEYLINDEWGLKTDVSNIDLAAFKAAADTMITEANGFSMVQDREIEANTFKQEIERQIDGALYIDPATGQWTVTLARKDYTPASLDIINEDEIMEVIGATRGSWEGTVNSIDVEFNLRDDNYKLTYAPAQDMANALILGNGAVDGMVISPARIKMPGVKTSALANSIAWRELRQQSYPLLRARLRLTRENYDLNRNSVFKWTDTERELNEVIMRVTEVDRGTPDDPAMVVTVVEDIFGFEAASYGNPAGTGWVAPSETLENFTYQTVFEAPRAIFTRDPEFTGDVVNSRVMAAVRAQGSAIQAAITQRNSSGTPSGGYTDSGAVAGFMLVGGLAADLSAGVANPTSSFEITQTPDGQFRLRTAFEEGTTNEDLGTELVNLIKINDEFMLVRSASNSGSNVQLSTIYRGALDSVQQDHTAGDNVYLLMVGASLADTLFPNTNNVDIELRAESFQERFAGTVTTWNLTMDKRGLRPYPPAAVLYNGSSTTYNTPDLESGGSGLNGFTFDVDWFRRNLTTGDEVAALTADDSSVDASHETRVRVFVDPAGANTEVFTGSWVTGSGAVAVDRLSIINAAVAGTTIRVQLETRHDISTETNLTSLNNLTHDVIPTTNLSGQFHLGSGVAVSTATASYTTAATGTFIVNIGAAYSTSVVQYRINGGSWTTAIAAGLTTGSIAGVTSGDTIELQHTVSEAPQPNFIELQNPSATAVAYGTFA